MLPYVVPMLPYTIIISGRYLYPWSLSGFTFCASMLLDAVAKGDQSVDGQVVAAGGAEEKDSSTAEPNDDVNEEDELEEPTDDASPEQEAPDTNVSEDELEVDDDDDDGNEDSPAADDQGI